MGDLAASSKTLDDDEAHFGAPKAPLTKEDTLFVLPQNHCAVIALTTASSQWQRDNEGVEIALDYARADIAWRYANITLTPNDFEKLQTLERTIINIIRRPDEQQTEFGVTLKL
ncbi:MULTISPECIES: hypothetical protein [Pseudoalteromonas]|uniref:Orphan protein n=1 Tax=Pseudoalteromonas translucida (strain TAC 125) TaxID=326442 RepID=Q3IGL0_PSET1|nr:MULTISPECIES: hypothetical protein [Pseudoalteromonas]MBB1404849.1 hypothetical protein [Pseudoalteromonas sp. SG44-5]CAI86623.1 putative orphan protein [Pseudoalteromonas translucida]